MKEMDADITAKILSLVEQDRARLFELLSISPQQAARLHWRVSNAAAAVKARAHEVSDTVE